MTHSEWLNNEYEQWIAALNECTVHNFKEHPMVNRMLSHVDVDVWRKQVVLSAIPRAQLNKIDSISLIGGRGDMGCICRMIYYAQQIIKLNPQSICEIGGGVGQFYAILRALGYEGRYFIYDLEPVSNFQIKFLQEVRNQTGLFTEQSSMPSELVVSFYALGEFDDTEKRAYAPMLRAMPHGYIAWNPHSGASDDLSIFPDNITVTPGIEPGIKIIQW